MPTESGLTADFSKVLLGIDGFSCDAFADAGMALTWNGDRNTLVSGADDINMFIAVGNTSALITLNLMMSSVVQDYVYAWLVVNNTRQLTLSDANGTTFLTSRTRSRQQSNAIWNNAHNPRSIDLHCANLAGPVGRVVS